MDKIVLAYTPSDKFSDWCCLADGDGNWFYEQRVRFYDAGCKEFNATCLWRPPRHERETGKEPYYNLVTKTVTAVPRVYITHCPSGEEWRKFKTIGDVRKSTLYIRG